jgi:L-Ala-D/L-Glu epimerase
MTPFTLEAFVETFPIKGKFTIARGSKTHATVVRVTVTKEGITGQGECLPYGRYGETVEGVISVLKAFFHKVSFDEKTPLTRETLLQELSAGAARNAVDCALWDWECKAHGKSIWQLLDLTPPETLETVYTLSVGSPEDVSKQIQANPPMSLYKMKMQGTENDLACLKTIHRLLPKGAKIMIDANESWTIPHYETMIPWLEKFGVVLLEQPFSAEIEKALATLPRPIPIYADESFHGVQDLEGLRSLYLGVNIKLDKTGGLTAALHIMQQAKHHGFDVMIGSMLATSLSMAPAFVLAAKGATYADLDSPLLLAEDRPEGLSCTYDLSMNSNREEIPLHTLKKSDKPWGNFLTPAHATLWG